MDTVPGFDRVQDENPTGAVFGPMFDDLMGRGVAKHWLELTEDTGVSVDAHGRCYALAGWTLVVDPASVLEAGWYVIAKGPGTINPDDGDNVSLSATEWAFIGSDAVSTHVLPARAGLARFPFFIGGKPGNGELAARLEMRDSMTIPDDFADSGASAETGADGSPVFSLRKNGVEFGTVTFAGTAGTFAMVDSPALPIEFVAGDILSLHAPSPADSTLEDISITLAGNRL